MTTANIPDLVAKLQQQEATIRVARKTLMETTLRAQSAFHETEQKLTQSICGLTSAPREIEAEQARIAELEERRAIVLMKQSELERQNADAPDWRQAGDGPARDQEHDRQQTLKLQLQELRAGTLLIAPNRAYARVQDIEARLKRSTERIERLRVQMAAHLQQAEALLAEP